MAEQTRRELLEAAWDKVEDGEEDVTVMEDSLGRSSPDSDGGVGHPSKRPDSAKDGLDLEAGKDDSSTTEEETIEEKPKKLAKDETQSKEEKDAAGLEAEHEEKPQVVVDKAPMAWKPEVREDWAKLPQRVREEINRRETHIRQTLSQTATVRKFAGDFANVVQPFSHLIRAQNSTPLHAVKNLMTTAASLMTGSPPQKAAVIAEICQNYGVDLKILDDYLANNWDVASGRLRNGGQQQRMEAPPQWAQPLFQMQEQIQQTMTAQQQRLQQEADEKISEMESQPFFDDLKDDIADVMEIAANRGRSMTLKQAYEKAIQLSPEISKIMTQRKRAAELNKNKGQVSRARRAASSISGSPSGKAAGNRGQGDKPISRRDQLREAWENAET